MVTTPNRDKIDWRFDSYNLAFTENKSIAICMTIPPNPLGSQFHRIYSQRQKDFPRYGEIGNLNHVKIQMRGNEKTSHDIQTVTST